MPLGDDTVDDLKREILTEMAENFFARRRALEVRLEAFAALRKAVMHRGQLALARWRALRDLLGAAPETDRFLTDMGFDVSALLAVPPAPTGDYLPRRPFALTAAGRFRKAVFSSYEMLFQAITAYNTDCFTPDPSDARRMQHRCGYQALVDEARELNAAIAAVNACQQPSDLARFTKDLDPERQEREAVCGSIQAASGALDTALAFPPIDFDALGPPHLPTPPPLPDVKKRLAALAKERFAADPARAASALTGHAPTP